MQKLSAGDAHVLVKAITHDGSSNAAAGKKEADHDEKKSSKDGQEK